MRVEEELRREARLKALAAGVTFTEVVDRLLRSYVEGKVVVKRREGEDGSSV